MEQHNDKTRKIQCILNTGGKDFKSDVEFYRTQKTCHIWFPLAVLQEEVGCYFDISASSFSKVFKPKVNRLFHKVAAFKAVMLLF